MDDRGPRSSQQNGRNQKQGSRNQYRGTGTKVGGEASNVRETPIRRGRAYWEALFRSFYRLGILNPGIGCVIGAQRDFSYYCYYVHGALFGLLYLQYRLNKFSKMKYRCITGATALQFFTLCRGITDCACGQVIFCHPSAKEAFHRALA